jgi:hypothetical protein
MIVYYTEYIAYQIYSNRNYARCGTFRLESSFPAKAKSRLVFPDPGGPSNNDILKNKNPRCKQKLQSAEKNRTFKFPDFLLAGFYDSTDVMKNGDRLLPAWNDVHNTQHILR